MRKLKYVTVDNRAWLNYKVKNIEPASTSATSVRKPARSVG